jgi:regulator of sigma E protease
MYLLSIDWSSVGLKAAQLLLSLSILVVLHEFGHYITARMFKCRVEKFYLFFDWKFSLFKKKIGETEYGIGWLPLGGYVKIAGMIDESLDKEQMKQPPQEWEFRSKPAWQRLIIMVGGVVVNVLLAFLIYAMILMVWGQKSVKIDSLKYGLAFNDPFFVESMGFQQGDKIIAVDGIVVENYEDILKKVLVADKEITIERNGKRVNLPVREDLIGQLVEKRKKTLDVPLISPRVPTFVYAIDSNSALNKSGLRKNDYIITVNGRVSAFRDQYDQIVKPLKKNDSVSLMIKRGDETLQFKANLKEDGQLGFVSAVSFETLDSIGLCQLEVKKYGFFEAFPAGVARAGAELGFYVDQFKKILSPKTGAYKGIGGFKAMGGVFSGKGWDWEHFWTITAFFSIVLAFMNMLPIPALDGGHVVFTLYEMITGRKPNEKFLEYAQYVGMIILLGLMLYANANDWFGWGK